MRTRSAFVALVLVVGLLTPAGHAARAAAPLASENPVPRARCAPGDHPERGLQGRVSAQDVADGYAAKGYTCNTRLVGHEGTAGGYRVHRYVDKANHVCGYYDPTLLYPGNVVADQSTGGVVVLDMANPAKPVVTVTLKTLAMQSPHESLSLNAQRGLLAADLGNPFTHLGFVDVYNLEPDCRHPALASTTPLGITGHEGTFSPDGKTFWVSGCDGGSIVALDVSNPALPVPVWGMEGGIRPHGLNVSDDGNTLFFAELGYYGNPPGMTTLDVSQVQARVPAPQVKVLNRLTWPTVSEPQTTLPVTIGGRRYVVEVDEFARADNAIPDDAPSHGKLPSSAPDAHVGAARIIDVKDPAHPVIISNIKLEVNTPANRPNILGDPGADSVTQGYAGHYCSVPQRSEPGIVACTFIISGLRVFDIRDPFHPKEIAYFNPPLAAGSSEYAMSAPAFDVARGQIWYTDANSGFYAVQVAKGVWPFKSFK
jgi:hypothetical protein